MIVIVNTVVRISIISVLSFNRDDLLSDLPAPAEYRIETSCLSDRLCEVSLEVERRLCFNWCKLIYPDVP